MSNSRMTCWNPEPERVSKDFLVFELIEPRVTVDAATSDWLEVLILALFNGSVGAARTVWQRSGPVRRPDERLHTKPIEVQTMISSQKMQHWMLRSENEILRDISCHSPSNALSNSTTGKHMKLKRPPKLNYRMISEWIEAQWKRKSGAVKLWKRKNT